MDNIQRNCLPFVPFCVYMIPHCFNNVEIQERNSCLIAFHSIFIFLFRYAFIVLAICLQAEKWSFCQSDAFQMALYCGSKADRIVLRSVLTRFTIPLEIQRIQYLFYLFFVNTRLPTFTVVHLIHTCLQWLEMYKCKIWIHDSIGVVAIDCQSSSSGQKIHSLRMTSWQLPWYHFWLGFSKL